jgi:hypothetical protein
MGQSKGCKIGPGGMCEKIIEQPTFGVRAGYIGVSNNDDATCIAWISVEQSDETKGGGAWTGDIGYMCGQAWYNSVEPAGKLKEGTEYTGPPYVPKCTWIDGDHTNTIENAALKFDVMAYGENVPDTANADACAPTIYAADSAPIAGKSFLPSFDLPSTLVCGYRSQLVWTNLLNTSLPGLPGKRSIHHRQRPHWMQDQLIMSNYTSQPAEQLCTSETSWGPDFIGHDGNFCDMSAKTLIPLCSTRDVDGCVEVDEEQGTLVKRMNVARRSANVVHKSYGKISKWGN